MDIDPKKLRQQSDHRHDSPLLCCTFDATGRFVLAGGRDRAVVCLDVAAGKLTTLAGHESWVTCLVDAGTQGVLSADQAGKVMAWDCAHDQPQPRWNIVAHDRSIQALAVRRDGAQFATSDRDGVIRIWQTADGERVHELRGVTQPVTGLAFHPDGTHLLVADRLPKKPNITRWEIATGKEVQRIEVPQLSAYRRVEDIEWGGIRAIEVSPDGNQMLACGSNDYAGPACVVVIDGATGQIARKLTSTLKGYCYSVRFHPQGFIVAASGDVGKGELRVWNSTQEEALTHVATLGPCTSVAIHPTDNRLATSHFIGKGSYPDAGSLTLWDWEGPA